jgi:glycerol uptake facilitator-like aquaporin
MAVITPRVRWGTREVDWTYVPDTTEVVGLARVLTVEAIGTMTLVFAAGGAIIMNAHTGDGLGLLGMAAATAAAYALLVLMFHSVSGGHINPGITLGMVAAGRMPPSIGLLYGLSQLAGAVVGALLLEIIFRDVVSDPAAAASLSFDGSAIDGWTGALLEGMLTFALVVVYFRTFLHGPADKSVSALILGGVVLLAFLVAFPLTGAAMNVARVFGTDLVAGGFADFGYYVLGIFGGALAGLTYRHIFAAEEEDY